MEKTYRNPLWFWLPALLLGWMFDTLFYGRQMGISFPIFILLSLLTGWMISWRNGIAWHRNALWLSLCIGFFAVMVIFRSDPLTAGLNLLFTLVFMGLLANTAVSGDWPRFAIPDYIQAAWQLFLDAIGQPLFYQWGAPTAGKPHGIGHILPILRGVGLAIPFLAIFSCLFASADPVFAKWLGELLRLEQIPEFAFRLGIIGAIAYGAVGVFIHALLQRRTGRRLFSEGRLIPHWLGTLEALIVLLLVNILFVVFVGIQFRYLFGGQANINLENFTYSEYAVRGFWELIVVALISLGMFLGLHASTERTKPREAGIFSFLSVVLMFLVQVILYSALTRLGLYEEAYGFSRLRTYTHVFLIWLGLLFLAWIVLELLGRLRFQSQALVLCALGFVISLNALNVDGFIVRQNIARAKGTGRLDYGYLASLSVDAVPALRDAFLQESEESAVLAGISLVCYRSQQVDPDRSWLEFQWSEHVAQEVFQDLSTRLLLFQEQLDDQGNPGVLHEGNYYSCHLILDDFDR